MAFCFAREDPASIEYAEYKCEDFYNQRRENDFGKNEISQLQSDLNNNIKINQNKLELYFLGIAIRFLAEGAQGKVYKCETNNEDSDLPVVAMKLWKNPEWV